MPHLSISTSSTPRLKRHGALAFLRDLYRASSPTSKKQKHSQHSWKSNHHHHDRESSARNKNESSSRNHHEYSSRNNRIHHPSHYHRSYSHEVPIQAQTQYQGGSGRHSHRSRYEQREDVHSPSYPASRTRYGSCLPIPFSSCHPLNGLKDLSEKTRKLTQTSTHPSSSK